MDDIPVPLPAKPERFMDRLRAFMRAQHLAYRTEKTYCMWITDFIRFHNMQRPEALNTSNVEEWLSHLANHRHVAINTQKTALNAVVFLYKQFLKTDIGIIQFGKANKGRRIPTVFTHDEATRILMGMKGTHKLVASLMYGSGLRVMEAVRLRVQDIDFAQNGIFVREAKGEKWRRTLLPKSLIDPLQAQIDYALAIHRQDLAEGYGEVYLPYALAKKYPSGPRNRLGNMFSPQLTGQRIRGVALSAAIILASSRSAERWPTHWKLRTSARRPVVIRSAIRSQQICFATEWIFAIFKS